MATFQQQLDQQAIFSPKLIEAYVPVQNGNKIAHYTTASGGLQILNGEKIWLRNARFMNDYSELQFGLQQMQNFFTKEENAPFREQLEQYEATCKKVHETCLSDAIFEFDQILPQILRKTYCTCLTIHEEEENQFGRLSMWRGYGRNQPAIAILINPEVFKKATDSLGAYSVPIDYGSPNSFAGDMNAAQQSIENNTNFLRTFSLDTMKWFLLNAMIANVIGNKHSGFKEEREWRVYHIEGFHQQGILTKSTEIINSRPQMVFNIPFGEHPEQNIDYLNIPDLIHGIVIGPTQYPEQIAEVFAKTLADKGVEQADEKVSISNIPWREAF